MILSRKKTRLGCYFNIFLKSPKLNIFILKNIKTLSRLSYQITQSLWYQVILKIFQTKCLVIVKKPVVTITTKSEVDFYFSDHEIKISTFISWDWFAIKKKWKFRYLVTSQTSPQHLCYWIHLANVCPVIFDCYLAAKIFF